MCMILSEPRTSRIKEPLDLFDLFLEGWMTTVGTR
jgi:hypothetical protein